MNEHTPNGTAPIIGVSWPRSGHHMLVRLLQLYFGTDFGYCDFYGGKPWVDEIDTCCGQIPCAHAERIWLTKNHDFDLDLAQIEGQRYLIQYRDFAPSVISNFELYVRNGGPDTPLSFRRFASGEFSRYLGFIERWVRSDFVRDQLALNYSTFLSDPQTELARAVAFIRPDMAIDTDRIAEAIATVDGQEVKQGKVTTLHKSGVHPERALTDFRHHTPALERELLGLRLHRRVVMEVFDAVLARAPAEPNVLRFQGFDSREALTEHLQASDEYRTRQSAAKP
jgi:hypothetical protein